MAIKNEFLENFKRRLPGVWFYQPNEGEFKEGIPSHGFGRIKYSEGSIYTGDIYYDGKRFNKIGFGMQEFFESWDYTVFGMTNHTSMAYYIGQFDYTKTDWIYGNGVMYLVDEHGQPKHFVKGFFQGTSKCGQWEGEFDYSSLANGFTPDMEIERFDDHLKFESVYKAYLKTFIDKNEKYDNIYIGDSYFDFLRDNTYTGITKENRLKSNYVNIAVGGTKYIDWIPFIKKLNLKNDPGQFIINMGFNDIHAGIENQKIETHVETVISLIHKKFPSSKITCLTICHATGFTQFYDKEIALSSYLINNAKRLNINVIDFASTIENEQKKTNCFNEDNCHLNTHGYDFLFDLLSKIE